MNTSQDVVSEFLLQTSDAAAEHERVKHSRADRRNVALEHERAKRSRMLTKRQDRQYAMTGVRYDV